MLSPKRNIYTMPLLPRIIAKEGQKTVQKPKPVDAHKGIVSSGHNRTTVHANWQWFQQYTQNMGKSKMKMGAGHESPPLVVELLVTVSLWEREREFSLRV